MTKNNNENIYKQIDKRNFNILENISRKESRKWKMIAHEELFSQLLFWYVKERQTYLDSENGQQLLLMNATNAAKQTAVQIYQKNFPAYVYKSIQEGRNFLSQDMVETLLKMYFMGELKNSKWNKIIEEYLSEIPDERISMARMRIVHKQTFGEIAKYYGYFKKDKKGNLLADKEGNVIPNTDLTKNRVHRVINNFWYKNYGLPETLEALTEKKNERTI